MTNIATAISLKDKLSARDVRKIVTILCEDIIRKYNKLLVVSLSWQYNLLYMIGPYIYIYATVNSEYLRIQVT